MVNLFSACSNNLVRRFLVRFVSCFMLFEFSSILCALTFYDLSERRPVVFSVFNLSQTLTLFASADWRPRTDHILLTAVGPWRNAGAVNSRSVLLLVRWYVVEQCVFRSLWLPNPLHTPADALIEQIANTTTGVVKTQGAVGVSLIVLPLGLSPAAFRLLIRFFFVCPPVFEHFGVILGCFLGYLLNYWLRLDL